MGKHGFNVLNAQVLKGFNPLISFGLGWIGFLFGFQLEFRYLRRFSKNYVFLSFLQFFLVFCLGGVSLVFVLKWLFSSEPSVLLSSMAVDLALGMAIIVERTFPAWGREFKALVLAVIGINQIIGPILLQRFLVRSGDARKKE